MSIQKTSNTPAAKPPVKATPAPAPANKPAAANTPSLGNDDFAFNKVPSAAKLAEARKQVATLGSMRPIPLANKDKAAWLQEAQALRAGAEPGVKVLEDADFFTKSVPAAEADAARAALQKLDDQIELCQERGGTKPGFHPLNPFRPINQFQKGIEGQMGNPLGAILGIVTLPAAITLDIVDLVTRPVQVVAYPFEWAWVGVKKAGQKLFNVG
ncbi:MAG: hypothetical protein JWM80_1883 [Cyanobacteria bacterium RYN_339]|nr:hypothetical protein [Cyanobacteria bacterium RYN_339]